VLSQLRQEKKLALDTETFGLAWHDPMFSLVISTSENQFYFNIYDIEDHRGRKPPLELVLGLKNLDLFKPLFREEILWFMMNAKYDMRRLEIEGLTITGEIHDIGITERILRNDHIQAYSLDVIGSRRGYQKDKTVEEYIKKHKLFTHVEIPGKKKIDVQKHFDKVPFAIMSTYACIDAEITFKIGMEQLRELGLQ
jgi:DNA polymerase I-like protein with 3'-5' exonuclease and polymerase domains